MEVNKEQPEITYKPTRRIQRRTSFFNWSNFFIFVVLILFLTSVSLGFLAAVLSRITLLETLLTLMPASGLLEPTNVIVLGIDATAGSKRSDTIMLLHVNPATRFAGVLSVPRDTQVSIPGYGKDKINHAYAYGGIELAKKTAAEFLKVDIPYYIKVDLSGLANIIDRLGGVTINVEKRMYYVDNAGKFFVDLKPGTQKLSGQQALGYVRFRHDNLGDFGRVERQQKFLHSLANEMIYGGNIVKAPALLYDLISNIETNLNSREILGLTIALRQAYESGNIEMETIPGESEMQRGIYYWMPDMAGLQKIIDKLFRRVG